MVLNMVVLMTVHRLKGSRVRRLGIDHGIDEAHFDSHQMGKVTREHDGDAVAVWQRINKA